MKVKNIMFSGFAAAILMGVGAANAVVANPVTLADQGYVDVKVSAVAEEVATKEASGNKFTDATKEAWKSADKAVDFPTIGVAERIALDSIAGISADIEDLTDIREKANNATTDIATLKGNAETEGSVAHSIAAALKTAEDDATAKANKALADAQADTTAQINALKLSETYEEKGAAADALTAAKEYTNTTVGELGTAESVVAYVDAKAEAAEEAAVAAANSAAASAIANSGHALATDVARDYETKTDAGDKLQAAKDYADSAVAALKVAETYETKVNASAQYATFETKTDAASKLTEAKRYTDAEITKLNVTQYAVEATVNNELAKKLDKTEINDAPGTYMVTSDGKGGFSYTKVRVATGVDGEGNATVTE